jgi:hypothetical protein
MGDFMTTTINASNNIGLVINSDNSQTIQFQANGANSMFIASNGNIGIGTTTPVAPFHVASANSYIKGSVIQSAFVSSNTLQTIATVALTAVSNLSISFTPIYANSIIVVDGLLSADYTYVSSYSVYKNGSPVITQASNYSNNYAQFTTYIGAGTGAAVNMRQMPFLYYETAGNTSARTYQIYAASTWSGSAYTMTINNRNLADMQSSSYIRVLEIAQ